MADIISQVTNMFTVPENGPRLSVGNSPFLIGTASGLPKKTAAKLADGTRVPDMQVRQSG